METRDKEFSINFLRVLIVSGLIMGILTFIDWIVSLNMSIKYESPVLLRVYAEPSMISSESPFSKSSTIEAMFLSTAYFIINVIMSIGMIMEF